MPQAAQERDSASAEVARLQAHVRDLQEQAQAAKLQAEQAATRGKELEMVRGWLGAFPQLSHHVHFNHHH